MIYLIDSNIFITAFRITSPMDIYPSFWSKFEEILRKEEVFSITKVKDELYYLEDDLKVWCNKNINSSYWLSTDDCMQEYAEIQNWAHRQNYNQNALHEFAESKNADPFIVAKALSSKRKDFPCTIVTLEESRPESKRRIFLPDICSHYNIKCINNNQFYRLLGVQF